MTNLHHLTTHSTTCWRTKCIHTFFSRFGSNATKYVMCIVRKIKQHQQKNNWQILPTEPIQQRDPTMNENSHLNANNGRHQYNKYRLGGANFLSLNMKIHPAETRANLRSFQTVQPNRVGPKNLGATNSEKQFFWFFSIFFLHYHPLLRP